MEVFKVIKPPLLVQASQMGKADKNDF